MSEHPPATPDPHSDFSSQAPLPDASPAAPPAAADGARPGEQSRRQHAAWPAPTPQAPVDFPVAAGPVVAEPAAPQPVIAEQAAPEPVIAEPVVTQAPAPRPISMAGADIPAFLAPEPEPPAAPEPQAPAAPEPVVTPAAAPEPAPAPPVAPAPTPVQPQPPLQTEGGASTAPPGFAASGIRAAESPSLLALDPSIDDEALEPAAAAPAPKRAAAPAAHAGAPAVAVAASTEPRSLARIIADAAPRSGDVRSFGRDRNSTLRVARALLIVSLTLIVAGPLLVRGLDRLTFTSQAIDHLRAIIRYPDAYGLPWITGICGVVSIVGFVVANMERYGERIGDRRTPVRRLNIGLGALLATAVSGGIFASLAAHGWAAGVASTTFWLLLCMAVPLWRTPGARAMAHQPERGWALLLFAALASVIVEPSVPGMLLVVLGFTRVRTHWAGVRDGHDDFTAGPIDTTNRRSALIILLTAIAAGSFGLHAVSVPSDKLPTAKTANPFPYAKEGPTATPPSFGGGGVPDTQTVPVTPAPTAPSIAP